MYIEYEDGSHGRAGVHPCTDCGRPNLWSPLRGFHHMRIAPWRHAGPCVPCGSKRVARLRRERTGNASSQVNAAIRAGRLPALWHQYCVDCGAPARDYDHRDYRKPLEVDPVCRSCNKLRGPGVYINAA